ncbi:MAG: iron-containing redox enzyme family protein [Fimbriimonadaceae bacterium]|nr:MAG: iron-containing redox enzyme family protein [Fimbriimonadaceae bacterium]
MDVRNQLDTIVADKNLLNHPFYQAWSAGTLPEAALATYAAEWGPFVALVPKGWEAHGDTGIADEERTHVELWARFADGLSTRVLNVPTLDATRRLAESTDRLFSDPVTSLGSLFAFEAQQPHTSTSKLDGLRKHYSVGERAEEYFAVHCDDVHEMEILAQRIEALSPEDQERAIAACKETAAALWDALTGIHEKHCAAA